MEATKTILSKRELTNIEKEIVRDFESLPLLNIKNLLDLELVWRGFKSASNLFLQAGVEDSQIPEIKSKIEKAGLLFKDEGIRTDKIYGQQGARICFVAKSGRDLDLISSLWFGDHVGDPKIYKEIGRMSGFPQTAIDTYDKFTKLEGERRKTVRDQLVLSEEEKRNLFGAELYPFSVFFYMSRKYWRTELETIKKWVEEIKLIDPELYSKICDRQPKLNL